MNSFLTSLLTFDNQYQYLHQHQAILTIDYYLIILIKSYCLVRLILSFLELSRLCLDFCFSYEFYNNFVKLELPDSIF
jgi:hypothetical protein